MPALDFQQEERKSLKVPKCNGKKEFNSPFNLYTFRPNFLPGPPGDRRPARTRSQKLALNLQPWHQHCMKIRSRYGIRLGSEGFSGPRESQLNCASPAADIPKPIPGLLLSLYHMYELSGKVYLRNFWISLNLFKNIILYPSNFLPVKFSARLNSFLLRIQRSCKKGNYGKKEVYFYNYEKASAEKRRRGLRAKDEVANCDLKMGMKVLRLLNGGAHCINNFSAIWAIHR